MTDRFDRDNYCAGICSGNQVRPLHIHGIGPTSAMASAFEWPAAIIACLDVPRLGALVQGAFTIDRLTQRIHHAALPADVGADRIAVGRQRHLIAHRHPGPGAEGQNMGALGVDADDLSQNRATLAVHDTALAHAHGTFQPGGGERQPGDRGHFANNPLAFNGSGKC